MFSVKDKGFELALTGQKLEKIELHFLLPRKIVIVFLPLSGIVKTNPQNSKSKQKNILASRPSGLPARGSRLFVLFVAFSATSAATPIQRLSPPGMATFANTSCPGYITDKPRQRPSAYVACRCSHSISLRSP